MPARYYVAQWSHDQKGFLDIPGSASKKQKEAEMIAEAFAHKYMVATKVTRKPHGWTAEKLVNTLLPQSGYRPVQKAALMTDTNYAPGEEE